MLSLGADLPVTIRRFLFTMIVACVLAGLVLYLLTSRHLHPIQILSGSLILGGGASNLTDRFVHQGFVIDFLNIGVGAVRTGIFNVADVAIMLGVMMLGWESVVRRRRPGQPATERIDGVDRTPPR